MLPNAEHIDFPPRTAIHRAAALGMLRSPGVLIDQRTYPQSLNPLPPSPGPTLQFTRHSLAQAEVPAALRHCGIPIGPRHCRDSSGVRCVKDATEEQQ